eukprot:jgi/Chlat1/8304/Chrsp78S07716
MSLFRRRRELEEPPVVEAPVTSASAARTTELLPSAEAHTDDLSRPAAGRLYNPYAELPAPFDINQLPGLYQLPDAPEHLFGEEALNKRRSWSENLTYYTGSGYLTGAIAGGGYGIVEGWRAKPESGVDTTKLRINRLLNSAGQRGRTAGNALGTLGLFYSSSESFISYLRGTDDWLNSLGAGLASGAVYKASAGPRTAAVAAAAGGLASAALLAGKQVTKRYAHQFM